MGVRSDNSTVSPRGGTAIPVSLYRPRKSLSPSKSSSGLISNVKVSNAAGSSLKKPAKGGSPKRKPKPGSSHARPKSSRAPAHGAPKVVRGANSHGSQPSTPVKKSPHSRSRQASQKRTDKSPNANRLQRKSQVSSKSNSGLRPWTPTAQTRGTAGLAVSKEEVDNLALTDDGEEILLKIEAHLSARRERLIDFFRGLDADNSGGVSRGELQRGLKARGIDYGKSDEANLMELLDPNGDGEIEYHELLAARKGLAAAQGKRFASTSISMADSVAGDLVHQAVQLTDGMMTLKLLDKKLKRENPEHKPLKVPAARPQLPIGAGSEDVLAARNVKYVPVWARPLHGGRVLSEQDKDRLKKRESTRAVDQWSARKQTQRRTERAQAMKAAEQEHAVISQFTSGRADRSTRKFKEWCDRKDKQKLKSRSNADTKKSFFVGKVHVDEFIAAMRRFDGIGEKVFELYEKLLSLLYSQERVLPARFFGILDQVDLEIRVHMEHQRALAEKAAYDAIPPTDMTKEQRTERQLLGLRQRIGEQIITKFITSRKAAVSFLARIRGELDKFDQVEPGQISEADFKTCVKNLELGISATNQVDLWKACMTKGSPLVKTAHLENFMVAALGKMRLNTVPHPTTQSFDVMAELCNICGLYEARMTFEDVHAEALKYRNEVNTGTVGWISTKLLLSELLRSHDGDSLPLGKRKDLMSCVGRYCKLIDTYSDGIVELSRIIVFFRFVEVEVNKRHKAQNMPFEERRRFEIRHRMFRAILQANEREGAKFASVNDRIMLGLSTAAPSILVGDKSEVRLSTASFISTLRRMGVGLSMVQVEELAKVCADRDGGIRLENVRDWFAESYAREELAKRAKADPRTAISDDMIRAMGVSATTALLGILDRYLGVLLQWGEDIFESDDVLPSPSASVPHAGLGPPTSSDGFDISWGRDKVGNKITMPPGSVAARDDITANTAIQPPNDFGPPDGFDASHSWRRASLSGSEALRRGSITSDGSIRPMSATSNASRR